VTPLVEHSTRPLSNTSSTSYLEPSPSKPFISQHCNHTAIMGVQMSTIYGYVVVCAVVAAVVAFERKRGKNAVGSVKKLKEKPQPVVKKESKPKRQRLEDTQRESYASKLKSQPPAQVYKDALSSEDETDDREFARQLSNAKQGTTFAAKATQETKQKSVKQSKARELPNAADEGRISAPSSTAGIDADDDQSSAASPVARPIDASGVSDMLEKPAPGPSVLRLTDTEEKKPKAKAPAKAPEAAETKKQRAQRRKREAEKAEREEIEKERKQKMDAQRRLARQSEGRPAQDGTASMAAIAAGKVWMGHGVNGKPNDQPASNGVVQPLDTMSKSADRTTQSEQPNGWKTTYLSEEEQIAKIREEEDSWNTVPTKARKSKKPSTEAQVENANHEEAATAAPPQPAPAAPKAQTVSRPARPFKQQSSFAALATDSPAEEETEWDVN
jgi:hypothetical protein